jgi:hypothetical protein
MEKLLVLLFGPLDSPQPLKRPNQREREKQQRRQEEKQDHSLLSGNHFFFGEQRGDFTSGDFHVDPIGGSHGSDDQRREFRRGGRQPLDARAEFRRAGQDRLKPFLKHDFFQERENELDEVGPERGA